MQHHKVLKKTADKMCSWEEVETLAIWLEIEPSEVMRLKNENNSIHEAAYQIVASCYHRNTNGVWEKIKEALFELNRQSAVIELGINQLIGQSDRSDNVFLSSGHVDCEALASDGANSACVTGACVTLTTKTDKQSL